MTTIGIDPSLNAVGYCIFPLGEAPWTVSPPPHITNQTLKIIWQYQHFLEFLQVNGNVHRVSIEQPFVLPMANRGAGGEQSSNMWALFTMFLYACREAKKPVAIFHLSQLRSLIHGRGKTTKDDTIMAARAAGINVKDDHQADAYFIAYYGHRFWQAACTPPEMKPTPAEYEIFFSEDKVSKGRLRGMIHRPGNAWFNFSDTSNPFNIQCQSKTR